MYNFMSCRHTTLLNYWTGVYKTSLVVWRTSITWTNSINLSDLALYRGSYSYIFCVLSAVTHCSEIKFKKTELQYTTSSSSNHTCHCLLSINLRPFWRQLFRKLIGLNGSVSVIATDWCSQWFRIAAFSVGPPAMGRSDRDVTDQAFPYGKPFCWKSVVIDMSNYCLISTTEFILCPRLYRSRCLLMLSVRTK